MEFDVYKTETGIVARPEGAIRQYTFNDPVNTHYIMDLRKDDQDNDPLRRFYFGFTLPPLLDYTGYSESEAHGFMKNMFSYRICPITNMKVPESVFSKTSNKSFEEKLKFINEVRNYIFGVRPDNPITTPPWRGIE